MIGFLQSTTTGDFARTASAGSPVSEIYVSFGKWREVRADTIVLFLLRASDS